MKKDSKYEQAVARYKQRVLDAAENCVLYRLAANRENIPLSLQKRVVEEAGILEVIRQVLGLDDAAVEAIYKELKVDMSL